MAVDHAAAWNELAAWIAAEPNRGRQLTLAHMAELIQKHTVPEEELERALRLVAPQVRELLFNRVPQLQELLTQPPESGAGSAPGRSETDSPSMAAALA